MGEVAPLIPTTHFTCRALTRAPWLLKGKDLASVLSTAWVMHLPRSITHLLKHGDDDATYLLVPHPYKRYQSVVVVISGHRLVTLYLAYESAWATDWIEKTPVHKRVRYTA